MAFFIGVLVVLLFDKFEKWYFCKHRIRMIAYELLPQDKYWHFDFTQAERDEFTRRATILFNKAHGK